MPEHPSDTPRRKVAVIGAGRVDPATQRLARKVGELVAERGAVLLCGGGGGVMEAAAAGARARGGATLAVLPGSGPEVTPANPHIDIALYSGMGQARNLILVLSADAVIAVGGEWGTLSEIALAMKHGRPAVLLESWDLGAPAGATTQLPPRAATPEEAVQRAFEAMRGAEGESR